MARLQNDGQRTIGTGSRLVSVSVPTLNSSRTIERCLMSVLNQIYSPIEVIVVDAYSSDGTADVARKLGAKVFFERGLTRQRFRCIQESRGEFMLLLDSDQVLSPDLVNKCVSILQSDPQLEALFLRDVSVSAVNGFTGKAQSKYLEMTRSDPRVLRGTALPRFFRSIALRSVERPRRELGYFDHAWIYSRIRVRDSQVAYTDAVAYHLEYNSTKFLARKFFRHYGNYFVPAFVEDWRLVLGKSVPKPFVFGAGGSIGATQRLNQLLLFGIKALSTTFGIFYSIFSQFNTLGRSKRSKVSHRPEPAVLS